MSQITLMNESCRTCVKRVGSGREEITLLSMSHVTHNGCITSHIYRESCRSQERRCAARYESCHTRWMDHVTHIERELQESGTKVRCQVWVMSHTWMSYVTLV